MQKNRFNKKTFLITGSSGQLGSKLIKKLSKMNANIIAVDQLSKSRINSKKIQYFQLDISKSDNVDQFFINLKKKNLNIDVLINNAGVSFFKPFEKRTEQELNNTINVNLKGTFYLIKNFSKYCKKNNSLKKIINISSIYSVISPDPSIYQKNDRRNSEIYGATKAGINQMTRYFAVHLAKKNILVNSVSPGGIFNDTSPQSKSFIKKYCQKNPMKRMASANEISDFILFMSSDECSYLNGQNIILDGGMSAW